MCVERYDKGQVIRLQGDAIEELSLLRSGEIEPCDESGEPLGPEDQEALRKSLGSMPNGVLFFGQWSQFDSSRKKYSYSIRAKSDTVVLVTLKHSTLRRLAERYLMEDVASSHANLLASLRVALHEDLHQFLTPIRLGEMLNLMKPFFAAQGSKIASKGETIQGLTLIISGAATELRTDGQRSRLLTQFDSVGTEYLSGHRSYKYDVTCASSRIEGLVVQWSDLEAMAERSLFAISNNGQVAAEAWVKDANGSNRECRRRRALLAVFLSPAPASRGLSPELFRAPLCRAGAGAACSVPAQEPQVRAAQLPLRHREEHGADRPGRHPGPSAAGIRVRGRGLLGVRQQDREARGA